MEFLLFSGEYKPSTLSMRRLLGLRRAALGLRGRLEEVLWSRGKNESSGRSLRGCRIGILGKDVEERWTVADKGKLNSARVTSHLSRVFLIHF